RVQPVRVGGPRLLGVDDDVERLGGGIDGGRAGDAALGDEVSGLAGVGRWDGDDARRVDEADLPERGGRLAVGVEGVDRVVLGGDVDDVVDAGRGGDAGDVERLGVGVAVQRVGGDLPELLRVHVRARERGLARVLALPRVVVFPGVDTREGGGWIEHGGRGPGAVHGEGAG